MALADDIALYALGYWSHEQHPFRINAICLNTKQRKHPCRACTDICPEGIVLHSGKAVWTGCTNCNLCVTACPTSAINQSSTSFEGLRKLVLTGDAPVSFACGRVEEPCDVRCSCLATVPWDLAAAAALANGVVLKAGACKDCPHENLVAKVKQLVRTLKAFLGQERFGQSVFMHDQPDRQRSAGYDRRLAFERVADGLAQGAETALSGQRDPTMSCYRALLLEVLSSYDADEAPILNWPTLLEEGSCKACEICTKMCPHKALELQIPGYTDKVADGEQADTGETPQEGASPASGQWLIHDATKCTQCGLCYISCPNDNLGGWGELLTGTLPALKAWPIQVQLCEKCGRPFKPKEEGDLRCIACARPKFGVPAVRK